VHLSVRLKPFILTMKYITPIILFIFTLTCNGQPSGDTPYLMVLNKSDHTAWQINAETGEKVKSYPTGQGPHEVAVSTDRKWAITTNYGSDEAGHTLTLINLDKESVEKTIDLSPYTRPHGIDWFGDSRRVMVTSETKKAVLVVDVLKSRVLRALPTDQDLSHMVALTADNQGAYVTNIFSGSVSVIDLQADSARQPTDIIKTGQGTEGIELIESTRQGWFSNRADHTISVVDLDSHQPVDTLQSPGFPIRLTASPDEQWIAATHAKSSEVAIFDTQSRQLIKRIPLKKPSDPDQQKRFIGNRFGNGAVPIGLTFSDNGKHLYISASQSDLVAVIDTDNWSLSDTIPTGTEPDGIAFFRH